MKALLSSVGASLLLAALFVQLFTASRSTSAVVDEPAHLTAGYLALTRGDLGVNREHPPLIKAIAALPLLVVKPRLPEPAPGGPLPGTEDFEFHYSREFLYRANDAGRLLAAARLPMMILTVLLGAVLFVWTREIAGAGAALAALALFSFEPGILGHGRLVTTDLGAAFFIMATLWTLRLTLRRGSLMGAMACGLLLGCALLAKFSTLLLLPIGGLLLLLDRFLRSREADAGGHGVDRAGEARRRAEATREPGGEGSAPAPGGSQAPTRGSRPDRSNGWGRTAILAAIVLLTGWLVLLAGYGFKGFPLPSLYVEGLQLARLKNVTLEGPTYLMGEISANGFWSYYLIALLVKTPIPLLLLSAVGSVSLLRHPSWRREALWLLLPPASWIVAMSALTHAQIGVRYVLPAVPFLCAAAGAGLPVLAGALSRRGSKEDGAALQALKARGGGSAEEAAAGAGSTACVAAGGVAGPGRAPARARAVVVVASAIILIGWQAASTLAAHPYHLSWFNALAGGSQNGWKWLADSNVDWGQDLIGLRRWQEGAGNPPVNLYYFGTADPEAEGIRRYPYGEVHPGWFAVSATHLAGVYLPDRDYFAVLRERKPDVSIGGSIFLYHLDPVPAPLLEPLRRRGPSP